MLWSCARPPNWFDVVLAVPIASEPASWCGHTFCLLLLVQGLTRFGGRLFFDTRVAASVTSVVSDWSVVMASTYRLCAHAPLHCLGKSTGPSSTDLLIVGALGGEGTTRLRETNQTAIGPGSTDKRVANTYVWMVLVTWTNSLSSFSGETL